MGKHGKIIKWAMGIFIRKMRMPNGHTSNTSCYGSARHVQRIATGLNQLELKTSGNFSGNVYHFCRLSYHLWQPPVEPNKNYSAVHCHRQVEHSFDHHKITTDVGYFVLPADPSFSLVDPILNGPVNGLQLAVSCWKYYLQYRVSRS